MVLHFSEISAKNHVLGIAALLWPRLARMPNKNI